MRGRSKKINYIQTFTDKILKVFKYVGLLFCLKDDKNLKF